MPTISYDQSAIIMTERFAIQRVMINRGPVMRSTKELFTNIRRMSSPKGLTEEDYHEIEFPSYMKSIMDERGIKPSELIVQMNMEKSYFYQILKGRRAPGRDFLIHLSFLLKLNLDETQRLLKIANRPPLYPRIRKDAAVIYAITHKMTYEKYEALIASLEEEHD